MNRRQFLYGAAALGGIFATNSVGAAYARAEGETAEQVEPLVTHKLTDNLSVIMGAGGNIAVMSLTEGGPLQIDSGLTDRVADVAAAVATAAGGVPGMLINTHWHFDHTGGNASLGKSKATIIAHSQCRYRLSTDQNVEALKMKFPASPAQALPIVTFGDSLSMFLGDEHITLTHVAPAHTDTDIFVHFAKANVIHAGDLMFNGFYPFIDYSTKGWIGGMVDGADAILKVANNSTKIIPGHGPIASRADLQAFRDMLHEVHQRIAKLVKTGKTPSQIAALKPLKDLDAKWGGGFMKPEEFVGCVAEGLKRRS